MEMKKMNKIIAILLLIVTSCDRHHDETPNITYYSIKNVSDYDVKITEYTIGYYDFEKGAQVGNVLKEYTFKKDSIYLFEEEVEGAGDAYPYFSHIDSLKITFSDTFSVISTKRNKMAKFLDLENCEVIDKSRYEHKVYYTITNADYEYAKQKLAEREANNGGE